MLLNKKDSDYSSLLIPALSYTKESLPVWYSHKTKYNFDHWLSCIVVIQMSWKFTFYSPPLGYIFSFRDEPIIRYD